MVYDKFYQGLKNNLAPGELIGKQAIFVYNLEPRKMMGLESQGMILTATGFDESLHLVSVGITCSEWYKTKVKRDSYEKNYSISID